VGAAIEARPPGEIPAVLRIISTIPRERVLHVTRRTAGELVFTSRSLRCDPSYCAEVVPDELEAIDGIVAARLSGSGLDEPKLSVRFEPARIREDEVVAAVSRLLESLPDPVYDRPIEIRYLGDGQS
jgi:hypothetical protein